MLSMNNMLQHRQQVGGTALTARPAMTLAFSHVRPCQGIHRSSSALFASKLSNPFRELASLISQKAIRQFGNAAPTSIIRTLPPIQTGLNSLEPDAATSTLELWYNLLRLLHEQGYFNDKKTPRDLLIQQQDDVMDAIVNFARRRNDLMSHLPFLAVAAVAEAELLPRDLPDRNLHDSARRLKETYDTRRAAAADKGQSHATMQDLLWVLRDWAVMPPTTVATVAPALPPALRHLLICIRHLSSLEPNPAATERAQRPETPIAAELAERSAVHPRPENDWKVKMKALWDKRILLFSWAYQFIAKVPRPAGTAYLSGNFAPVLDELLEELELVEGKLPEGLDGCYIRTGPNPFLKPFAGYHWFDGDGMLHLVRLHNGKASYCNRFVETERLKQERKAGLPIFLRFGDVYGLRGLVLSVLFLLCCVVGILDMNKGIGTANTALVYHAGRLLALHEGDLPYGIRILSNGRVETMGRMRMQESWISHFTAHPKLDPQNGELLFIGNKPESKPHLSAGIMDMYGKLVRQWNIDFPPRPMLHDMGVTERYLVILDMPICFDLEDLVKGTSLPFKFRKELPIRIGLLRRDQPSCLEGFADVQWFQLPGPSFIALHVATSWEEPNGDVKVGHRM
ncbi:hypothetical protein Vafri_12967 [Volvox africanus]|nr:hypothetical protein Vafri_12967 [Volvox africanus]